METIDEEYIRRCFELARRGMGSVAPNPMVGAVIVKDGEVIGEGWHRKFGEGHAEVNAVASVADKNLLRGATIYVSLEPCSHWGKTPPCANLLIQCGFKRVVVSNLDPFPEVSGRGLRMLKESGVEVVSGVCEKEGWDLNKRFFTFHTKHRPYIILKWAESADGFISGKDGKPVMISTEETRRQVHRWRSEEMAIMVGTQTVITDNPSLTVRYWSGKNPIRIVLDRNLRIPKESRIFDNAAQTIVFTSETSATGYCDNVEFVVMRSCTNALDLEEVMTELYKRNIQSVLVEGGKTLLENFIGLGLYDEMRVERNDDLFLGEGISAPRR